MTDIEAKALALVNKVGRDWGNVEMPAENINRAHDARCEALCRAIEQHEAFKQEVSDAVEYALATPDAVDLHHFIIPKPKPDPLVEVLGAVDADRLRAALKARGLEIREKGQ